MQDKFLASSPLIFHLPSCQRPLLDKLYLILAQPSSAVSSLARAYKFPVFPATRARKFLCRRELESDMQTSTVHEFVRPAAWACWPCVPLGVVLDFERFRHAVCS